MAKKGYVLLDDTGVDPTICLDEDNMASDSATALATQQSIKAYVDASAGGASFGLVDQIPHTNATVDDFDYSANFSYDGEVMVLASATSTNSIVIGGGTATGINAAMSDNVRIGYESGATALGSQRSVFIGTQSGWNQEGDYSIAIGYQAAYNPAATAGPGAIAIGYQALASPLRCDYTVAIGYWAMSNADGDDCVAIGKEANFRGTGDFNICIGYQAGYEIDGTDNVIIGHSACSALANTTNNAVIIGEDAGAIMTSGTGAIIIGAGAVSNVAAGPQNAVIIGTGAGTTHSGNFGVVIGAQAGQATTSGAGGVTIGYQAGNSFATGSYNVAIGYQAAQSTVSAVGYSVCIGYQAGLGNDDSDCVFIGRSSGATNSGANNVFLGAYTGDANNAGADNTFIGDSAGTDNVSGNQNVYVGSLAGENSTGSGNVFLGYDCGSDETGDNKLYIENSNSASPLIWGDFNTDDVKINGTFEVTEGMINNITTSAAGAYAVLVTDFIILKTGITGGGDTVTLPSTAATGQRFFIKDAAGTAGTNNITVATAGAENIDGNATIVLNADDDGVQVVFDGSNYFVIGRV